MFRTATSWRAGARLCAGGIALGTLAATTATVGASPAAGHSSVSAMPVVAVADGALRGTTAGGVDEFLGVPYAAPPVGPLRWRPPQAATGRGELRHGVGRRRERRSGNRVAEAFDDGP